MTLTLYFWRISGVPIHLVLFGYPMTLQFNVVIFLEYVQPPFEFILAFVLTLLGWFGVQVRPGNRLWQSALHGIYGSVACRFSGISRYIPSI